MIRQAMPNDAKPIAKIHVDAWRSTYKGIWPDDFLASLSYQEREKQWMERLSDKAQQRFVFVAESDGSGIVGFAEMRKERRDAWRKHANCGQGAMSDDGRRQKVKGEST